MLTRAQGDALLADLDKAFAAALAHAQQARDEGESGIVHGALSLFGADHDSQLDAQVGAVNIMGSAVARLRGILPAAVDDPAMGDRWLDAARSAMHELTTVQDDITEATFEDTLAKTATATGTQIKEGVNMAAGSAARFAWAAIPWWVLVGGGLVAAGFVFVQVRRVA